MGAKTRRSLQSEKTTLTDTSIVLRMTLAEFLVGIGAFAVHLALLISKVPRREADLPRTIFQNPGWTLFVLSLVLSQGAYWLSVVPLVRYLRSRRSVGN